MTETSSCFDKRDETLLIVLGILDHRRDKVQNEKKISARLLHPDNGGQAEDIPPDRDNAQTFN